MKNMKKHIKSGLFLLSVALTGIWGCEKETFDDYAQTDLLFPQPSITRLEPSTAEVGAEVRIAGTNLDKTLRVIVGANSREAQIVSRSAGEVIFKVPRTASSGRVRLETAFKKFAELAPLTITYPKTRVTDCPDKIERTQAFKLKGDNMDLLTAVYIGDTRVKVDGASGTTSEISIATTGLTLPDEVTLRFEALGGVEPGSCGPIPVEDYDPTTKFDPVAPLVLLDFENGDNPFVGLDVIPVNSVAASSPLGRGSRYLHIEVADVPDPWGTNIGNIYMNGATLSGFHKPHLTFMVNTNGHQGYFQLHAGFDGKKGGGHFTGASSSNPNDNYTFQTNGWEWRSIDLAAFPWEDWWGTGKPEFSGNGTLDFVEFFLKQGNGADPFELNIDQVMITDGPFKPVNTLFTFENGVADFQSNTGAVTGFNQSTGTGTAMGDKYYSVQKQAVGNWDWTGAIEGVGPFDMSQIECPFLNIWVNTGTKKGYFQVETNQNGTKWGIGQTAPDYYFQTNGAWQLVSIDLKKAGWGNWGGSGTEIDWSGALDYIKIGFTTGNVGGANLEDYELSVDDIIISDGPLF
jgi:hypothetical protein